MTEHDEVQSHYDSCACYKAGERRGEKTRIMQSPKGGPFVPIITLEVPLEKVHDIPRDLPYGVPFFGEAQVYVVVNGVLVGALRVVNDDASHILSLKMDR